MHIYCLMCAWIMPTDWQKWLFCSLFFSLWWPCVPLRSHGARFLCLFCPLGESPVCFWNNQKREAISAPAHTSFLNFHHKELVIRTAARSLPKVFAPFYPSEEIMLLDLGLNPLVDFWTGLLSFFPFLIAYTFFFPKKLLASDSLSIFLPVSVFQWVAHYHHASLK